MGAGRFVELCRSLEAKHGPRFAPPKLVVEMAETGGTFYGRAKQAAQAA
jgi:3-hydroxyacyl-CoA dehydrogenase/enoyl-CoA hydratase/3-hydroxybutyryl-CoA epimerase